MMKFISSEIVLHEAKLGMKAKVYIKGAFETNSNFIIQ